MYDSFNLDKYVRLHEWEFNIKYEGKKCRSIELNSSHIAIIVNKTLKK